MYIRYMIFMLGLALPATALADDVEKEEVKVIDITPKSAYFKISVFNLADKSNSFLRVVGILGTDFIIVPDRVAGQLELHIGPTRATFSESVGDGLSVQSTWASNSIVSVLAGSRLTIFRRSFMEVGAYIKFESSLFDQEMGSESFAFTSDGTAYDVSDFANEHASVALGWTRWIAGFDVHVPLGICTPYLTLGLEQHSFTVDLDIDKEGKDLIRSLGEDPSSLTEEQEVEYIAPTIGLGTDLRLPNLPLVLTADVVLIPVSIEKLFLSASIGIALEL